ncbi:MAG: hypothetical protein II547_01175 [Treponema sp.]|nr:hypothetical protein [Treponema sp.]
MNVNLVKEPKAKNNFPFKNSTPMDVRYGFWGVVTEVHPEDCTVNVRTDMGFEIGGVRVASHKWVTAAKDKHLTGERYLPPIDTYVFCMMPNGEYASAFVLCSGFAYQEAVHGDFKQEGEDAEKTHEAVENSGWHMTTDYRTGTKKFENKTDSEPTITLEIDQESDGEEKATLTIHGNTVTISKDGIKIESDKDMGLQISGDAEIEAQNVTIKSSVKTEIKGGQVVIGGTVTPTGTGALCGLPSCLFTGAPHVGDTSVNA